jgi:hypothetical protein
MAASSLHESLHERDFYGWVAQQSPWTLAQALDTTTLCDTLGDWDGLNGRVD